ncbi:hypothetical protein ACFLQQ_04030 [Actinomycetota bacterium]
MKIVYLDQNKWIELARSYYGKTSGSGTDIKNILKFIQDSLEKQTIILPLSTIHYMETARISDPNRRESLGSFMYEFSGGYTIAFYSEILIHELECALSKRFQQVSKRPFNLISKGALHAFGESLLTRAASKMLGDSKKIIESAKTLGYLDIEKDLLTGTDPWGLPALPFRNNIYRNNFMKHQKKLREKNLDQLSPQRLEDMLYAISWLDILDSVNEILEYHNINPDELSLQGKKGLTEILNELLTRQVDLHLHRQLLKNPDLKPKQSDLEDWAGLGPASMYCDVLICEKHFADLMTRDNFKTKAIIITNLTELPSII